MELIIKKKIGKNVYTFVAPGENLFDMVMTSQQLSFGDIDKCGCEGCGSENIILNARVSGAKKHKYVEVKCLNCKGALVFGRMQETPNTFYLRRNKDTKKYDWKSYDANAKNED